MKYILSCFKLKQLFCFLLLLSITYTTYAQIRRITTINISNDVEQKMLSVLEEKHCNEGQCTDLKIEESYLFVFEEVGDYGPMWYGDTIVINQNGFLISYEFHKNDSLADKSKIPYSSKDWHSSERLFIPHDHSGVYRMYTCRFGGVPPSHGFAHRRDTWNKQIDKIVEILKYIK